MWSKVKKKEMIEVWKEWFRYEEYTSNTKLYYIFSIIEFFNRENERIYTFKLMFWYHINLLSNLKVMG